MDKERLSEREKDIDRESERQRKLDNCGLSKSKVDFVFPAMHCLNQPEMNSILLWEILVLEGLNIFTILKISLRKDAQN